ncbi:MAG: hypothetical protein HGA44_01280 [Cellulomonadaceae bacterium]|nr:hypothetical protein [Cellulomonadaceae bacterium]
MPSIAGLASLKLMAWVDRRVETRRDAVDLQTIIGWYGTADLFDELYENHVELLEAYDFDPDQACAHRLGRDIADVLRAETPRLLGVLDDDTLGRLVADMPATLVDQPAMLRALRSGLRGEAGPRPGA